MEDFTLTLRTYLAIRTMEETGCQWVLAVEAVATTLLEHPEWNSEDRRTFPEWERELNRQRESTT